MKQSTIDRIRDSHKDVVIWKYSYRYDRMTGQTLRCKTEDVGRMWIDEEGHQYDAWEVVL